MVSSFGVGPTKVMLLSTTRLGQIGVFGKKSVAGMDGIDIVGLGDVDQGLDIEVSLNRLAAVRRADLVGFIRLEAVE